MPLSIGIQFRATSHEADCGELVLGTELFAEIFEGEHGHSE
jgi:hypothetical protein